MVVPWRLRLRLFSLHRHPIRISPGSTVALFHHSLSCDLPVLSLPSSPEPTRILSLKSTESSPELSPCVEVPLGSAKLFQIIRFVQTAFTKAMYLMIWDVLIVRFRRHSRVHRPWFRDADEVCTIFCSQPAAFSSYRCGGLRIGVVLLSDNYSVKVPLGIHPRPQVIPCLCLRYFHCCDHVKHDVLVQPNLSELHKRQGLCRHPLRRRQMVIRRLYHLLLPSRTQHS